MILALSQLVGTLIAFPPFATIIYRTVDGTGGKR